MQKLMLLPVVGLVGALGLACTGETCEEIDCSSVGGDSSERVTVCKRPRECDGCFYWKLLDEDGTKVNECQDGSYEGTIASCEPFMDRHVSDWCTMGGFCKQNGNGCGKSNTAMSFCCSGWCGASGSCEAK